MTGAGGGHGLGAHGGGTRSAAAPARSHATTPAGSARGNGASSCYRPGVGRYLRSGDADDGRMVDALADLRDLMTLWREQVGPGARVRAVGTGYVRPALCPAWSEATDILGLTAAQRRRFSSDERTTLLSVQKWIDDQIALYEAKISGRKARYRRENKRFTAQDVAPWTKRIRLLEGLEQDLSAALKSGLGHKSHLLILARVINNEAGVASAKAKRAIAYAYVNMVGTMRAPKRGEISGYQSLTSHWSGLPDDTARLAFLQSYAGCLQIADERLDDKTPSTNDPTKGAIRWVSPTGLKTYDAQRDGARFYARTYQGLVDRRFPTWARDPSDPEVAAMKRAGSLASNYDEYAISGVPATQFLFYVGVK